MFLIIQRAGIAQSVYRRAMGWTAGARFPAVQDFLFTASIPTLEPTQPNGNRELFPRDKATGAWTLLRTFIYCRGQECWSYTSIPPIFLHGIVHNHLSTGTTLPLFLPLFLIIQMIFQWVGTRMTLSGAALYQRGNTTCNSRTDGRQWRRGPFSPVLCSAW
jgi:hypothetical protein